MDDSKTADQTATSQVLLSCNDLPANIEFFEGIGFRLDQIFPDDRPQVAIMSGFGLSLRLDQQANQGPVTIYLLVDENDAYANKQLSAPNGTTLFFISRHYKLNVVTPNHQLEVRQLVDNDPWIVGRAGMLYRDLLPGRLQGSMMASHIRIPNGGPVPDMVHFHSIQFQLIFCYRGWVKLVYEDQGPPFILEAGDCVTQPPEIRHRVLEASDNLEVIEIGVPAEHMTTIDHEMTLPTKNYFPEKVFNGQRFSHHQQSMAVWEDWEVDGFTYRDTGIAEASNGMASVRVIRSISDHNYSSKLKAHGCDLHFSFVMAGRLILKAKGHEDKRLDQGDAFVIPCDLDCSWSDCSADLELLEVALPALK